MDQLASRRKLRRARWGGALGLGLWLLCGPVRAHEGDPRVWRIGFPAVDGGQAWVVDEMGLLLERPEGFRWLCDDALSLTAGLRSAAPVAEDGSVWLAATREGIYRSTDRGCGFSRVAGPLAGHFVGPLLPHPTRPAELLAGTESLAQSNDVFRTTDGGRSWNGAGLGLSGRVRSLLRAPSAPARVYLSHSLGLARSDDGGERFTAIPLAEGVRGDEFRLLAVDPLRPDRVFAAVESFPDGALLVSDDGGGRWQRLLTVVGDAPESLVADGAGRIWLSAPFGGLWRSEDDGAGWERLETPGVLGCLAHDPRDGSLWACLRGAPLPWVVAASTDGGRSWQARLGAYAEIVGGLGCPAGSPTAVICEAQCDPADRACATDPDAADGGVEGAAEGAPPIRELPRARSAGCRAGSAEGAWAPRFAWGLALALTLGLAQRRRRQRGRHPRAGLDIRRP